MYEKTAREPDLMQTLWAYRTRITMQDMTAALNNVPDVKHKHPLLHKFLQEVCKVICLALQGSGISFKLSFILLDDICICMVIHALCTSDMFHVMTVGATAASTAVPSKCSPASESLSGLS